MRRALVSVIACAILAAGALPAGAATTSVSVVDFAFSPKTVKIAQGGAVQWHNTGTRTHTATQLSPLSAFSTGNIAPGATSAAKTLTAAGTYPYMCSIHPSMLGTVKVPVKIRPTTGDDSTTFTVTVASVAAPTGFVYDVQMRVGDGAWTAWKTGLTTASTTFQPTSIGSYSFRSTLRKTAGGASKPSPAKTITVT